MTQATERDEAAQADVYGGILEYAARSAKTWHEGWISGEGAWRMATSLGVAALIPWLRFKDAMIQIGNEQKELTYQLDATAQ